MADKEKKVRTVRMGIPCTPEGLADYNKVWSDMEECFAYFAKHSKDVK